MKFGRNTGSVGQGWRMLVVLVEGRKRDCTAYNNIHLLVPLHRDIQKINITSNVKYPSVTDLKTLGPIGSN